MTIKVPAIEPLTETVEPETHDPLITLAGQLAEKHTVTRNAAGQNLDLLAHPDAYDRLLRQVYLHFTRAAEEELIISYAGEWLLDNFYIVQQAYTQIQENMPGSYYAELPKLAGTGFPRIYAIARAIIDFASSRFTLDQVRDFVNVYQDTEPLMMGELWALPTMLRAGLLENLISTVSQLTGLKPETTIFSQNGPVDDTLVANCIISLRLLAAQDWKIFFEEVSRVDQILRADPADVYGRMDFETRNRYRGVIEELAPNTGHDEEAAARMAIHLAELAAPSGNGRAAHVGYYLLDAGRAQLEEATGYRPTIGTRIRRRLSNPPAAFFLGAVAVFTVILLLGIARYVTLAGGSMIQAAAICLLALLPACDMAINLINWLANRFVPPRVLPKMDFSKGIPAEYRTMIVVPALLVDGDDIESLAQQLELHYLRNADPSITVGLLADFTDAPFEHMPDDDSLTELAAARIQGLNQKYGETDRGPFYFFLRRRQWNPGEQVWMGWERKRGKLMEFNRLLLNPGSETSFIVQIGDLSVLHDIRYVITLDADTILPQDSAHRLVATLAHPLNRAEFAPDSNDPAAGYTILQPRIEIKPAAANRSPYAQIFSGDIGLDLYTLAVSDVYQDLFGEGIYVGKGIYDVAAFERSLAGRTRENTLLSHDLFEGLYGRAALVTDVVLLEDYPAHYLAHTSRLHRWIRGDWQLLPWLMPRVPGAGDQKLPNRFSLLDRWKIIDNLRRSLTRPALLVFFLAGWLGLPGSAGGWTLIALFLLSAPHIISLFNLLALARSGAVRGAVRERSRIASYRWALSLAFLPYESLLIVDAILTTLTRLFIRRRRMLQWTTAAAHTAQILGATSASMLVWRQMFISIPLIVGAALAIILFNPGALVTAAPLLLIWLIAPQFATRISRPISYAPPPLTDDQRQQLRTLARRTWLFFEDFAGPEDHWLPPDHYQEQPRGIVAHHTSPTNIGLYLLSTLAAYDLGYIGLLELALRFRATFENIEQLERYRGHLLNWYDTRTLKPLLPQYVSTVDSGNLAGSLLALRQGFRDLRQTPVTRPERWQGVLDTLGVLSETMHEAQAEAEIAPLLARLEAISQLIRAEQDEPIQRATLLARLLEHEWPDFTQSLMTFIESGSPAFEAARLNDLRIYSGRVRHHLSNMQRDMNLLGPWLTLFAHPPALLTDPDTDPAIREAWTGLLDALPRVPLLGEVADIYRAAQVQVDRLAEQIAANDTHQAALDWCQQLTQALESARLAAQGLLIGFEDLERQAEALFQAMDFRFLFDPDRFLFHIGYNVTSERLDNNYYDLLASEARIASFIAIAKGEIPATHWLYLGRPLSQIDGAQALLSWSGSMFEYLMPSLLMMDYEGTLLAQSNHVVVNHHITYGQQLGLPWGISESGYYAFDGNLNYQYRAFGVPDLAFKRGLAADRVVTPYAALIALPVSPQAVMQNMTRYRQLDMLSTYGFYESMDYTPARLALGRDQAVVQEYMAHHQGMILVSLVNYLYNNPMVRRFHADPRVQSIDLLLQERLPQQITFQPPSPEETTVTRPEPLQSTTTPWLTPADTPAPRVHFLSNGDYGVMITNAGSGFSQWRENALTRWRADTTLDDWGTWIYLLDRDSGALWSAGYQPTGIEPEFHNTLFFAHKVEFQRRERDLSLNMEITVPPDDDLEVRRITLINHSDRPRHLLLSSYGEIVMAPQDARHPAFNKMFIESEYLPHLNALLFRRRPRAANEAPFYMLHMIVLEPGYEPQISYETDRAVFLGRGQTPRHPAIFPGGFSSTTGATLDPIMALAQTIELEPYSSIQVVYLTLAAETRQDVIQMAENFRAWSMIQRAFDQARYQSERELRQLGLNTLELERIQRLLSGLFYPQPSLRAESSRLAVNTKPQPGLWAFGISGDYPILLVRVSDETEIELVRDVLQAHTYWRDRQIKVTLVILNQRDTGYTQELYNSVHRLIVRTGSELWINRHDGIFIQRGDQMNDSDRALLAASARVYLDASRGSLAAQIEQIPLPPVPLPVFVPAMSGPETPRDMPPLPRPDDLVFDNGFGGFSPDGREYVIYLQPGQTTPAPWINVIANPDFGCLVSAAGGGYSWQGNSSENRLTVWRNDPVSDTPGEIVYLRDEETAEIWTPTPLPTGSAEPYLIRHGAGYSITEHHSHGLRQQMTQFVAPGDPVKIVRLRLENTWGRVRRITITYYAEWVLGTVRDVSQQYIIPEFDADSQTLLVRNPYSIEFGEHVTFITANQQFHGLTADRTEFLGRLGSYARPAALGRVGLSGTVRAGLDPCATIQVHIDLPPGEAKTVFFLMGAGPNRESALQLARTYQNADQVEAAWRGVTDFWDQTLSAVTTKTPDPAFDLIIRWTLYQTLSCRIWGRTALYQSSGAFGFRDQLQDVMALVYSHPDLLRQHILRAARHQFDAGDVLHWWHPPSGRGVRTHFSDDLLWLPLVAAYYVEATGDWDLLAEEVPFLRGDPLNPDEDERYGFYESTAETYSIYEHCRRALEKGTTAGRHGLPLMGSGDWNDGMNRVGIEGRGESVWMGWFLYTVLARFIPLVEHLGETAQADSYRKQMNALKKAIERHAWDGQWYQRAFYDDGTPLGSSQSDECQIDSIAQSWSVISGAAKLERTRQAMESVMERLVRQDDQLLLLFTPPFDKTAHDPGYIKGYPPGIRENGGQYTHAALWTVWAFAMMGDGDRAGDLFRLLNPIHHTDSRDKAERYRVEPYVVAADVYSVPPHVGRGGWTWYTGSSGWMHRLGVEAILGLRLSGDTFRVDPCIPRDWPGFEITYRYGATEYRIQVENPDRINRGIRQITVDGAVLDGIDIPLRDDGQIHAVTVILGIK